MSLVGLAIIGKKSEPLYLCDCSSACSILLAGDTKRKKRASDSGDDEGGDSDEQPHVEQEQQQQKPEDDGGGGDPFGFAEARRANGIRDSMSMEDRFAVHSALDRLDEAIETTTLGLPVPRGRTGAWLGLLMTVDDRNVYGYITGKLICIFMFTQDSTSGFEAGRATSIYKSPNCTCSCLPSQPPESKSSF